MCFFMTELLGLFGGILFACLCICVRLESSVHWCDMKFNCIATGTFQNGTKQSAKCTGQNEFFTVLSPNSAKPRTQEAQQPD